MSNLAAISDRIDTILSKSIGFTRTNPVVFAIAVLVLNMYASAVAPSLPPSVTWIFDNSFFKIAFVFLLLFISKVSPSIALVLSVAFIVSLTYATKNKFLEYFDLIHTPLKQSGNGEVSGRSATNAARNAVANARSLGQSVSVVSGTEKTSGGAAVTPQLITNVGGKTIVKNPEVTIQPIVVLSDTGEPTMIMPTVAFQSPVTMNSNPVTECHSSRPFDITKITSISGTDFELASV